MDKSALLSSVNLDWMFLKMFQVITGLKILQAAPLGQSLIPRNHEWLEEASLINRRKRISLYYCLQTGSL